jgi:tRNA (uracil-5-)-methyltransferase TRM9
MIEPTRAALLALNRDFYDSQAESFASTRDHAWPGWQRVLAVVPERASLLDAGCGNGRFALFLAESDRSDVHYTGVDESRALLEAARKRTCELPGPGSLRFCQGNLLEYETLPAGSFDAIVLFGVLHHVPGFEERAALIARLGEHLSPKGHLVATIWRFGSDPRVRGRTVPWQDSGLDVDPTSLEPGDELLRWGNSQDVFRYCHFVDDDEVDRLLERSQSAGLEVADRFRSDGRSGTLNEYVIWSRRAV